MKAMKAAKAMKAMKVMKAAKVMKAMKAMKVMKVSKRMAKVIAFRGGNTGGATRLKKENLVKNKTGKVVSKKKSLLGKKSPWIVAVAAARKALGVKGFCAIKKGSALYKKAKELYKK